MDEVHLDLSLSNMDGFASPPDLWEKPLVTDSILHSHDHLKLRLYPVPDGTLIAASCGECGGIFERVAEMGAPESAAGRRRVKGEMTDRLYRWCEGHFECSATPRQHRLPGEMLAATRERLDDARERLRSGDAVEPICVLGVEDSPPLLSPIPVFREKRLYLASWHAAVRLTVPDEFGPLRYAVLIAESWQGRSVESDPPSESANRRECLWVEQVTPELRRAGSVPIHRKGDAVEEGPARLGEPRWVTSSWSRLSMGLLATALGGPNPAREMRRSLGLNY